MRRFIDNSEGDSIFNYDKDMRKKTKMRISLGAQPRQTFNMSAERLELDRGNSNMSQML